MNIPKTALGKINFWLRLGDNDDYHNSSLDGHLNTLQEFIPNEKLTKYTKYGFESKTFKNLNYISLFVGDNDAQPIRELTKQEIEYINYWLKH